MSDPWAGLLDEDETILWQGAPERRVRIEWGSAMQPFFLFFTGFSVFWMVMAAQAPGPFWMFGLLFFGVGIYNLVFVHYWKAHVRKHTHYTLTNKRAFIATALPFKGKALASYPIRPETRIDFIDGNLASIFFATRKLKSDDDGHEKKIGFEDIEDGRGVYQQLRRVQQEIA